MSNNLYIRNYSTLIKFKTKDTNLQKQIFDILN